MRFTRTKLRSLIPCWLSCNRHRLRAIDGDVSERQGRPARLREVEEGMRLVLAR